MKQIYTEILINAPPAAIWRVLTDFKNYPSWNPYEILMEGDIEEGKSFRGIVQFPEAWKTRHRCRTLRLLPEKEWIYQSHYLNIPGIMDGEYILQLEEEGPNRTRFIQKQNIQGLLVPLVWKWWSGDLISIGLGMMNHALKSVVEGGETLDKERGVVMRFGDQDKAALERLRGSWALVTGASSGIGREYAVQLVAAGINVILLARRVELLEELAAQLRENDEIEVKVMAHDLADPSVGEHLRRALHAEGIRIRVLCNIAGSDTWGYFEDTPLHVYRSMIEVQIWSLIEFTYLFREDLESHLTSAVINVSSLAAVQPVPYITVYAAIKAFVLEFSQSLYGEWLRRGILVQTVLAGPTETGMAAFPRLKKYGIFEKFMLPAEVVKISLGHLSRRMPIVTPGPRPFLHWLFATVFPARVVILTLGHRFRPGQRSDGT
ncbi:SDR family NAD(P)-dependent oxidoreductase [Propionivibrio sp.]|uniref:SDR family NAD(P)-dependent oxidoreductase n=1 Tax=Propionivibrio sp. TaxID=2212460 RepID=UPI00261AAE0F|nr:SDR family NAD(P)-dependent oxidoreductase [Propionivibrio sp.]